MTVAPNDILTITCLDSAANNYKVYSSEGCAVAPTGELVILSTDKYAKFYYCHPDDEKVSFDKQPNKRTLNIK